MLAFKGPLNYPAVEIYLWCHSCALVYNEDVAARIFRNGVIAELRAFGDRNAALALRYTS